MKTELRKKYFRYIKLGVMALAPMIILLLPADYFDQGPALCPSVIFFNKTCFGCGITRAIMHLMHGEFSIAKEFHAYVFIIFPILLGLYITEFVYSIKGKSFLF